MRSREVDLRGHRPQDIFLSFKRDLGRFLLKSRRFRPSASVGEETKLNDDGRSSSNCVTCNASDEHENSY